MKTLYAFVILTFIGLLIIGCSDKSVTPVETTGVNDNPVVLQKDTGPGAWIIRYEGNGAYWFSNYDEGYIVTLGMKTDPWSCCSSGFSTDIFSIKEIYLPNTDPDLRRIINQTKGKDLVAKVWSIASWPSEYWETFCQFWSQVEPMEPFAVGTANFSISDNDVYAWAQDNKNSNVVNGKGNGTVVGQDGKVYKLNIIFHYMWDGVDGTRYQEVMKVQLTPTGK